MLFNMPKQIIPIGLFFIVAICNYSNTALVLEKSKEYSRQQISLKIEVVKTCYVYMELEQQRPPFHSQDVHFNIILYPLWTRNFRKHFTTLKSFFR